MALFVSDKDTFDVKVFVVEEGDRVYASTDLEALQEALKADEVKNDKPEDYTFTFRRVSYKANVEITKKAIIINGDDISVDPSTYRYERFVQLLKDWTLKDGKGKKVPVSRSNIDKLNTVIANAVLEQMDTML